MARDGGFALDFLKKITNVHWQEGLLSFLYSGGDGMFGSSDGDEWEAVPSSVRATSLAWIDDVWVGCNPEEGCWRSENGAETWQSAGPKLKQVVAVWPRETHTDQTGIFAGFMEDEEGDNGLIYISQDLGKSWSIVKSIPTSIPFGDNENGFEKIIGISAGGGGIFVCTVRGATAYANGDGMIYTAWDGGGFNDGQMAFGPGTNNKPIPGVSLPTRGFLAAAVGYDAQSDSYIATGMREDRTTGVRDAYFIYSESSGGSFAAGEGSIIASAHTVVVSGDYMSVANSAAGGAGAFASGLERVFSNEQPAQAEVYFIPGGAAMLESFIRSFCFKPDGKEPDTSGETSGLFACVSYRDGAGGVYIAKPEGAWVKKHSGTAIGFVEGAVAVGKL